MNRVPAANRDLPRLLDAHLFVICPNNSGSTFLAGALEACRAAWRLPREGQRMHGCAGPLCPGGRMARTAGFPAACGPPSRAGWTCSRTRATTTGRAPAGYGTSTPSPPAPARMDDVRRIMAETDARFGRAGVLVNAAGPAGATS